MSVLTAEDGTEEASWAEPFPEDKFNEVNKIPVGNVAESITAHR